MQKLEQSRSFFRTTNDAEKMIKSIDRYAWKHSSLIYSICVIFASNSFVSPNLGSRVQLCV